MLNLLHIDLEDFKKVIIQHFEWKRILKEEQEAKKLVDKVDNWDRRQEVSKQNVINSPEGQAAIKILLEKYGEYDCIYEDNDSRSTTYGGRSHNRVVIDKLTWDSANGIDVETDDGYSIGVYDIPYHDPERDAAHAALKQCEQEKDRIQKMNTDESLFIGDMIESAAKHRGSSSLAQQLIAAVESVQGF